MTATQNDILLWVAEAKDKGSAFLIIGLDWFDYENFPVFCETAEDCHKALADLRDSNNRYDEVYDFSLEIEAQLKERRALHLPSS